MGSHLPGRRSRRSFGRFMAACAALSAYDGALCTLRVTHASPYLMCLARSGADSALAAGGWALLLGTSSRLVSVRRQQLDLVAASRLYRSPCVNLTSMLDGHQKGSTPLWHPVGFPNCLLCTSPCVLCAKGRKCAKHSSTPFSFIAVRTGRDSVWARRSQPGSWCTGRS